MQILFLLAALGLAQEPPLQIPPPTPEAPAAEPAPAPSATKTAAPATAPSAARPQTPAPRQTAASSGPSPLSFYSESFTFSWDRTIPLSINVDGLKVNSIFFNKRVVESGFLGALKGAEFGTRAQVEVTNTGKHPKVPGFAVAVIDKDGRLLGVASGGTKVGTVKPGETETFDLNFTQVKERLASGDKFYFAIELRN
ncbi:hypothetical protein GETHLI_13280 [Geothrix limicola]|uniref:Uncharacterized protein n=1 Tax=Geothrix limicola TaxID=2927978 RepID=A0ABQ5QE98_9BACT|nr:hypothetical protein [Geothrix limicola]GLH72826.1 hypothetical protein GETHLI_13280 [Geothrix limicola]